MGLRDEAARWADENSEAAQTNAAAAAAAAVPLPLPDWHAELVAELRSLRVPRFAVHTWSNRKRRDPWKPSKDFKFTKTGETVWIVRFRKPDEGSRSGWSVPEHLGISDSAVGHVSQTYGHVVGFTPFAQRDGRELASWHPRIVSLFSALVEARTSVVNHTTGATVELLRSLADW